MNQTKRPVVTVNTGSASTILGLFWLVHTMVSSSKQRKTQAPEHFPKGNLTCWSFHVQLKALQLSQYIALYTCHCPGEFAKVDIGLNQWWQTEWCQHAHDDRVMSACTWWQSDVSMNMMTEWCQHAHDDRVMSACTWWQREWCQHAHDDRVMSACTWWQTEWCQHAHDDRVMSACTWWQSDVSMHMWQV